MKVQHSLLTFAAVLLTQAAQAQNIVGPGGTYTNVFGPSESVNSTLSGFLTQTASANTQDVGLWTVRADGGLGIAALGLTVTGTQGQVRMNTDSLQFRVNNTGLISDLGLDIDAGVALDWEATLNLDQPGNVILVQPSTIYSITFDAAFNSNLSLLGEYSVDVLSGNNVIFSTGNGSLADLLGLGLLNGERDATITLNVDTSSTATGGTLGLRFRGDELLGADLLDLASPTYASFSNIQITGSPIPEPSGMILVSCAGGLLILRRRR